MKRISILLIILQVSINGYSQKNNDSYYSGIEYIRIKSEIAEGWNTWNTRSITSFVLLPEAVSVDFCIKNKSNNEILSKVLIGRRGENAESVLPLGHATDGSYIDFIVSWRNIEIRFQSCKVERDIYFLISPLAGNSDGEIQIKPGEMWWDRDGKVMTGKNKLIYNLPSGDIKLHILGGKIIKDTGSDYLSCDAGKEIVMSSDSTLPVPEIRNKMRLAENDYKRMRLEYGEDSDIYNALQNVIAWDMIYDPDGQRELTTVSRVWNVYRGGYVIFCWDTYFAAYMHSLEEKNLAYTNAIEMTNAMTESGFVPNLSASKGIKTRDRSQPPVGSFVVREIYRHYREKWFLEEVFDKLVTWNRWWPANRDTDGFLCWGSSPFEPYLRNMDKNANSRFGAALESGLDNSPMYDDIPFDTIRNQLKLADVGLMSLYIMDCEALADIAGELGEYETKKELLSRAEKYRINLNKLWDEQTGIYLNKRLDNNEFSHRLSPINFYPLLAEAPSQKQAERMINEHFYNPDEFWGDYILPSIARNDESYEDNNYWRGRIWAPMNFLVYLGLRNYKLDKARKDLVSKSVELLLNQWLNNGYICENYNAETGECTDVESSDLYYHWGALLGFISLIENGFVPSPEDDL